ncbi:hypothetical protein [Sporosarcina highlanderae]|uniref:Lipoprotein n=1 Tax=Sporosarcina highlanderae TaxID=3035916 RepID=A0ABT8JNE8_9BACL|nr:hypothetical protein [Sporosarcina highlanderae]MDN4605912.1 hypothetical protein [Sporosarcina highlanderae]
MKTMIRCFLYSISLVLILSACGNTSSNESFRNIKWGMTMDEVISIEEKAGNSYYDIFELSNTDIIEYEDVIVNGYKATLEYSFANEVSGSEVIHLQNLIPKKLTQGQEDIINSNLSDEEKNTRIIELREKYKDEVEESLKFMTETKTVKFIDYILYESLYTFKGLDEDDIIGIKGSLFKKYGKPSEPNEGMDSTYLYWYLDTIKIFYREDIEKGKARVTYTANYNTLQDKMRNNNSNGGEL